MRSMPKLVVGVTLIMGVSLLLVLALILILLAELYCSLLSKRCCSQNGNTTSTQQGSEEGLPIAVPLPATRHRQGCSAYDQGVLRPGPGGRLFPIVKEQQQQSHHAISATSPHFMGLISTSSSPASSLVLSRCPPAPPRLRTISTALEANNSEIEEEDRCGNIDAAAGGGGGGVENFMYISNPIYDGEEALMANTPFETPETSPSRLLSGSPSPTTNCSTPPLTPMKKLPLSASSVTLMDGSSLIASVSGTDSNAASSSSSGSPCTSPSW